MDGLPSAESAKGPEQAGEGRDSREEEKGPRLGELQGIPTRAREKTKKRRGDKRRSAH